MGQGALGIEARAGELIALWTALDHPPSRRAVEAERAFLRRIGGGCKTPAGVFARLEDGRWRLTAMLASPDGRSLLRRNVDGAAGEEPLALAADLAERMLAEAAPEILAVLHPGRSATGQSSPQ
jgi:hydroxymethylbilane synthase